MHSEAQWLGDHTCRKRCPLLTRNESLCVCRAKIKQMILELGVGKQALGALRATLPVCSCSPLLLFHRGALLSLYSCCSHACSATGLLWWEPEGRHKCVLVLTEDYGRTGPRACPILRESLKAPHQAVGEQRKTINITFSRGRGDEGTSVLKQDRVKSFQSRLKN